MWLLAVDQALGTTGFYHPSRVWRDQMAFRVAICSCGKVEVGDSFFRIPIRDTQSLDTWETVQRYVRCHIFCLLETTLFADKSTAYAHTKYLPLFQNFEQIGTYSWRSATLTHLYRSLCRASRWSHHPRTRAWMSRSAMSIRHDIDYMDEFVLRPYISIIIPTKLHAHLDVCDTVRLLLSFECVEWNSADRVFRHNGYAQSHSACIGHPS
ncbi:uncharacterized protein DS421_16g530150 [Arachis hypogaea]|nr:uncharacterized protein DS421_16g530150 [Arachis hypogaea]